MRIKFSYLVRISFARIFIVNSQIVMEIMTEKDLLDFLISVFPDFETVWNSETNYFLDDDLYTSHGVCAEFSHYFRENYTEFSNKQLEILFNKIEDIIEFPENRDEIDNALCTCFLENIAQTESGNFAKQFLAKRSKAFFKYWN